METFDAFVTALAHTQSVQRVMTSMYTQVCEYKILIPPYMSN